jgi:hypothetical protein
MELTMTMTDEGAMQHITRELGDIHASRGIIGGGMKNKSDGPVRYGPRRCVRASSMIAAILT